MTAVVSFHPAASVRAEPAAQRLGTAGPPLPPFLPPMFAKGLHQELGVSIEGKKERKMRPTVGTVARQASMLRSSSEGRRLTERCHVS
jgi:hypothetical protein